MNFKVENIDNNFENEEWLNKPRTDLKMIPIMHKLGYDIKFDYTDSRHGRTTPQYVPHNSVSFSKGNYNIWKGINRIKKDDEIFSDLIEVWHTARLVDKHYCNHKTFEDINDAILHETETE